MDRVTVYQGLASGDPDVDAIFRLTRVAKDNRLNVTFDNLAPPVGLPPGTFCPFNSQLTFYTYDVFWALFLPISVTFRVCDIWRSYWAQTLMWLSNQRLAYLPPIVDQVRNKHSLHHDMIEENDLYVKSGSLLKFLRSWKCNELHFFTCVSKLTKDMAANSYWKSEESDILDAWLSDLSSLGYSPPAMSSAASLKLARKNKLPIVHLQPNEQTTSLVHSSNIPAARNTIYFDTTKTTVKKICDKRPKATSLSQNKNILLIIGCKYTKYIPFYEAMYRSSFKNIIYCILSKENISNLSVSLIILPDWNHLLCVTEAMSLGHAVEGYFFIGPNLYINKQFLSKQSFLTTIVPNVEYIIVPSSNVQHLCLEPHSTCVSFLVGDLKQYLKILFLSYKDITETQKTCISNMILKSRGGKDQIFFRDIVTLYIPKKFIKLRALLMEANHPNMIYFIIPFMYCVDKDTTVLDVANIVSNRKDHIIYPFVYQELLAKNKLHTNLFCSVL